MLSTSLLLALVSSAPLAEMQAASGVAREYSTKHGRLVLVIPADWQPVSSPYRHTFAALRSPDGSGVVGFDIISDPDGFTLGQLEQGIGVAKWGAQEHAEGRRVSIKKLSRPGNRGFYIFYKRPSPSDGGFWYRAQGAVLISDLSLSFVLDYQADDGPFLESVLGAVQSAVFYAFVPPFRSIATFEKANQAYLKKDFSRAEKLFQKLIEADKNSSYAHLYLAHSLYYQSKYSEAIPVYRRALELRRASGLLTLAVERLLIDQLSMAYGLSGKPQEARLLLEAAIEEDSEYPMYYYTLACTYAEQGELENALSNLRLGYARRAHMLPGETYPNPRKNDSFRGFLGDERFEAALREMGL